MLEFIRNNVPDEELLAQIAEEAVELSHAALKMRRCMDGRNPTPVRLSEAIAKFEEEIADVLLCLEVMGYDMKGLAKYRPMMDAKLERWAERLLDAEVHDGL